MAQWHKGNCSISLGEEDSDFPSLVDELKKVTEVKPLIKVQDKLKKKEEKKQEKKRAKKNAGISVNLGDILISGAQPEEVIIDEPETDIVDYMKLVGMEDDEEEDDEFDEILKEQKGARLKAKKDNEIKKDFADNLALLYNLLEDAKSFEKIMDKSFTDANKGRRTQGYSKYTSDMAQAVVQARKATLDIIKEINGVKKTIHDLQNKSESRKGAEVSAQNTDAFVNNYINGIMNSYGRGNIMDQIRGSAYARQNTARLNTSNGSGVVETEQSEYGHYEDTNDPFDMEAMVGGFRNHTSLTDRRRDELMEKIENRLDNEDNRFRSEEGNSYIQFERFEPKIMVKKCIDDGKWKFIAVSKDNQELYGYPLPTRESAGKMTFTSDGSLCTDSKGRSYKVIQFFRKDEPDA